MRFPKSAVLRDPIRGLLHGLRGEAEAMDTAVDLAMEEAGRFEDTKMFGDGGERDPEWFGKFGDFGFAKSETGKDGAAGGVGEGGEGVIERGRIFNHTV